MTEPAEAEVESAARALAREEENWEDNWRTKIASARAALTAAAQVRERATQAELDALYATSKHVSRDPALMPIYSATEDPDVCGYRLPDGE